MLNQGKKRNLSVGKYKPDFKQNHFKNVNFSFLNGLKRISLLVMEFSFKGRKQIMLNAHSFPLFSNEHTLDK